METIKLRVVGCGDAFGSGGRLNTCFHLEAKETSLLIDCGATSLPGLKRLGIATDEIDCILITHFHGDHYAGVPFLLMEAAVNNRKKKLTIISPPTGEERIRQLVDLLYPESNPLQKLDVDFISYEATHELVMQHFTILPFTVIHTEAALPHGLRVSISDKTISYSGDTSWTDTLLPLSADADLFICECNFFSTQVKGHLSYQELTSKMKLLTAKRIVLTHFDEEMLNKVNEISLLCAMDGMEILI